MARINLQPPEGLDRRADGTVEVHSVFLTLQGEGPWAGVPAVFVRLSGCNISCPGCDTEYTSVRVRSTPEQVLNTVRVKGKPTPDHKAPELVVVTGGEPFRQDCGPMVKELLAAGYTVQIETNGLLNPPDGFPMYSPNLSVVVSPKGAQIAPKLRDRLGSGVHLKYVLRAGEVDPKDGLPTAVLENGRMPAKPPAFVAPWQIFLQPMDEQDEERNAANRKAVVESCLRFGYRCCIQQHKLLGLD